MWRTSKPMLRATCCCLLLALISLSQAAAQKSKDDSQETKLLIMEHLWNEAQVNRDAGVLDAMIGSQFINTEYDGEVSDKAKFLADIKDPQFKPTILTIQDVKVSMYADSAVVVGIYHTKGMYQNKPYEHFGRFRYLDILRRPLAMRRQPHQSAEEVVFIRP